MKRINKEPKASRKEEKLEVKKPKKEFNIEIVKVGKLEDKTAGGPCRYECIIPKCGPPC